MRCAHTLNQPYHHQHRSTTSLPKHTSNSRCFSPARVPTTSRGILQRKLCGRMFQRSKTGFCTQVSSGDSHCKSIFTVELSWKTNKVHTSDSGDRGQQTSCLSCQPPQTLSGASHGTTVPKTHSATTDLYRGCSSASSQASSPYVCPSDYHVECVPHNSSLSSRVTSNFGSFRSLPQLLLHSFEVIITS